MALGIMKWIYAGPARQPVKKLNKWSEIYSSEDID
jgi:hypothetical protein